VSAKLVQDLLSFTFLGDSQDDLKVGLQPFMVADGSEEYRRANMELARTYGFLQDSNHGVMYSDLMTLEAKEVKSVPLTYFELEKCLGMFGNLLAVTLGDQHPLVTTYRIFWDMLTRGMRNDLQIMLDTMGRIKPAHILRSIQLQCYSWFNHRRARIQPQEPMFVNMLHNIALQSYVLPHLPPPAAMKPHSAMSGTPSVPLTAPTASTQSSHTTSDMSVLTSPTFLTRATQPSVQTRGTFMANLTPDCTLQSLVPSNLRLRHLIGQDLPPMTDENQPICLSIHTRQGC
jgi:hypothetical protein